MVVAHAGGSVLAGGDLSAGIDRAVDAGIPLIELDVRRTGDECSSSTTGVRRAS
jgi:glycerophosphoryl diester phosphodiesterase